jgi:hypothetical protein
METTSRSRKVCQNSTISLLDIDILPPLMHAVRRAKLATIQSEKDKDKKVGSSL